MSTLPHSNPDRHAQQGMTLVQLMVALAVGLVLTTMYLTFSADFLGASRQADQRNALTVEGSLALSALTQDLAHVGFLGVSGGRPILATASTLPGYALPTITDCTTGAIPVGFNTVSFLAFETAPVLTRYPCISQTNYLAGSPLLILRGADGESVASGDFGGETTQFLVQSSPADEPTTIVFSGPDYASLPTNVPRRWMTAGATADAPGYRYFAHMYYLRPCARPAAGVGNVRGGCQSNSDGGVPIPSLVRQELLVGGWRETLVAKGVEAIGIRWGIDDNHDGMIDRYTSAPTAGDMDRAVEAKVGVVVRSDKAMPGHDDSAIQYALPDGTRYACAGSVACRYPRQLMARTITLNNCRHRRAAGAQSC